MIPESAQAFLGLGMIALDVAVGFAAGWFLRGRKERRRA